VAAPVLKLTENPLDHNKHHLMALDNWYTSIDVARLLISEPRNMNVVGTVRKSKRSNSSKKIGKHEYLFYSLDGFKNSSYTF
jgi:hypothetical protein